MRTDITYSWEFYTYTEKVKIKCAKCGKTMTKTISVKYREDVKLDMEYIKRKKEECLSQPQLCHNCLKQEALKDVKHKIIDVDEKIEYANNCCDMFKAAKNEFRLACASIEKELKDTILLYKDGEYVVRFCDAYDEPKLYCYQINKVRPWKETSKEMMFGLSEGCPENDRIAPFSKCHITGEWFPDRKKAIRNLDK